MPATASAMPSSRAITLALTVRINVFGRPVFSRSGIACLYRSQSRNESAKAPSLLGDCESVDFGCAAEESEGSDWWLAGMAAKFGSCGGGAAFEPGFQPGGSSRGTQSKYSRDQVPSAMTPSSPEFSASINALFSLATAYATKLSKLKVFSMISAGSPACTVPCACCDGATHASICLVFRLA